MWPLVRPFRENVKEVRKRRKCRNESKKNVIFER